MEYQVQEGKPKKNGFTLLEIIVVMAISLILTMGAAYAGFYLVSIQDLSITTHNIETAIETARDYTLDHYNGYANYGIAFTGTTYKLYQGTSYSGSNTVVNATTIPADVSINSINFNGNSYLYFQSVTGLPSNTGSLIVFTHWGSYTISVNANGIISLTRSS